MASAKIDIFNWAAIKLGEKQMLATTDNTVVARTFNGLFDEVRDAELRRNNWNFAMRRASIPALATAPDWGYQQQFQLPTDYLRLVQVNEFYIRPFTKTKGPWHVEGRVILTDMTGPLKIRYIARIENCGLFDSLFVEAIASKLAYEGCEAITQSNGKRQFAAKDYANALSEAARCAAIENPPDQFPNGSWLDSRESRGGGCGGDGGYGLYGSGTVVL